ncbi:MAG: tripartite tricarboxylate transporter permease [Burkholderiales bacterium]|nr:tripartite tricarboxylate transporter permease [Burkholderiales bacterium]
MLETLSLMGQGFLNALNPLTLVLMVLATALGITIGCLPGLSAAMGVALLLPVTFGMNPAQGLIVLGGIYCGAIFGGSISAILIHTPGTPASAATAIEGYALTKKGQAAKALSVACFASFCGGLLSCISLYFFSPLLAELALLFKSPEYFWLSIFGLTIIAGVSSKSLLKGFISGILGLLISTVGMDPMEGVERFMFGNASLYNGINVTCALIGLFSMSQVLILAEAKFKARGKATKFTGSVIINRKDIRLIFPTICRSWLIGNILGILPGAGATIACFMGYNEARRFSKHKEDFGNGAIEGVAGSEAANNAVTGGSLIPTLTLGIPGESGTAVLMGGLIIHGLQPGPELFTKYAELTYTFFAGFVLVQFAMLAVGLLGCRVFAQVSRLSDSILIPAIFLLCVVGSFAINNNFDEVLIMFLFGIIGYLVRKFDLNAAAIVLGLILGPIGENGLRRSLYLSDGDPSILFSTPLCWMLIGLCVLGTLSPLLMAKLTKSVEKETKEDLKESKAS